MSAKKQFFRGLFLLGVVGFWGGFSPLALSNDSATEEAFDESIDFDGAMGESELWLDELEKVTPVTLTNMKQDPRNVPASITVITRDEIERRGFLDLYDLLRSVTGMTVVKRSSLFASIEHSGGGVYLGRGMDIQVNGVTQTMPTHSTATLEGLLPIDAVERVEIVRGSNAAADGGSKSFKGTINFISRKPEYNEQSFVTSSADTDGRVQGFGYYNPANEDHHISFSGSYSNDDGLGGYETINTEEAAPIEKAGDDAETQHFYVQYFNELSQHDQLRVDTSFLNGEFTTSGVSLSDDVTVEDSKGEMDYFSIATHYTHLMSGGDELTLTASHQDWQWQQDWNVCGPTYVASDEAKAYAAEHIDEVPDLFASANVPLTADFFEVTGVSPSPELTALLIKREQEGQKVGVCGYRPLSTDISQTTLKFQTTKHYSEQLRWVAGLEGNLASISGELIDGTNRYEKYRGFANLQWEYSKTVVNFGAANEHYNDQDSISTRLGVNYHVARNQTFRIVGSKGKKTPDVADVDNGLGKLTIYFHEEVNGSDKHTIYDGDTLQKNTSPQVIYSQEVGYLWSPKRKHQVDFRLFRDRIANASFYDIYLAFVPPSGNVDKRGSEVQYSGVSGKQHYGMSLHYHDSDSGQAEEDYAATGVSVYYNTQLYEKVSFAANVYYNKRQLSWVDDLSSIKTEIVDLQLSRQVTRDLDVTLTYRFESSPHVSRLFYPDLYINNYDELSTWMLGFRAAF